MTGDWLLAVDPGTTHSGYVTLRPDNTISTAAVITNQDMLAAIEHWGLSYPQSDLAIEMIASYGMPVGAEVFETVLWIGRMYQAYRGENAPMLVYRRDVKLHLCGNARAKDANVRQALIDLIGPHGTVRNPGPTYGIKSHMWSALGVAATVRKLEPAGGAPRPWSKRQHDPDEWREGPDYFVDTR
jgi:hypothetical protein